MKKTILLILLMKGGQLIAGPTVYFANGNIINFGDPEAPRNNYSGVITVVHDSRAEEPRYRAMLDDKDMKALIYINAVSESRVIRIEGR